MFEGESDVLDDTNTDKFVEVSPGSLADAFEANDLFEPAAGQNEISLSPLTPRQFTKLVIETTLPIQKIEAMYSGAQALMTVGFAVSCSFFV